ncbi:BON domain-containing protein [Cupriavidus sp. WKF15]|uniref:BON domain-containing protein n=1 Tax=Cupriavidus sp. WKF15 TaxID=3032282 RepID=UPI0023E31F85|nr:BON domain-containing protein [Cupriavidus sp. WKF15]WER48781.1 BON domain-containing protein [Cupriavidus sp. WKF15]
MSNYYDDERERGRQWDDDDWQPESGRETWQSERMRRRMTPGQTSYGGPARQRGGEPEAYRRWSDERYGRQDTDDRYREYGAARRPDYPTRGRYGDRYGSSDQGSYETQASYRGGDRGDEGGRYGSDLRAGMNGGYGWERAREWRRDPQAWQRDDRYAEREWRRSTERARASDRGEGGRDTYFSDLRSDTRYWTDPDDERLEDRRYGRHYSREAAQRRGWEVDNGRDDNRDDDEHGTLYNLGRRIGEAVGDWFGTSERHERPTGPRGYQRTDERIRDHICERLSYARRLDVSDVSVDVKDGVVTLSGTVNSRSQKYYIEELVDDTYGVREVNNDIHVRRDAGSPSQPGSGEVTGSTWRA